MNTINVLNPTDAIKTIVAHDFPELIHAIIDDGVREGKEQAGVARGLKSKEKNSQNTKTHHNMNEWGYTKMVEEIQSKYPEIDIRIVDTYGCGNGKITIEFSEEFKKLTEVYGEIDISHNGVTTGFYLRNTSPLEERQYYHRYKKAIYNTHGNSEKIVHILAWIQDVFISKILPEREKTRLASKNKQRLIDKEIGRLHHPSVFHGSIRTTSNIEKAA